MTIEEQILAIWVADTAAVALVPVARFKVPGDWQGITPDYVIQQPIAERPPDPTQTGPIGSLRVWEFYQFSIYCRSYSSGLAIANKMRTLFYGNKSGTQFFHLGNRWGGEDQSTHVGLWIAEFRIAEVLT